jgi:hypothetical protein
VKKRNFISLTSLAVTVLFSFGSLAQEKAEVVVQVKKDGKMIRDTTFQLDDASEADDVMEMIEMMTGKGMDQDMNLVFISEDGKKTELKEAGGDSLVWVSEGDSGDDHVKVIRYKIREGDPDHDEHVTVMKSEDGKNFNVIVDDDNEVTVEKEIKVVVSGDEEGEWKVIKSGDDEGEDDDVQVQVKVIKKEKKEEKK